VSRRSVAFRASGVRPWWRAGGGMPCQRSQLLQPIVAAPVPCPPLCALPVCIKCTCALLCVWPGSAAVPPLLVSCWLLCAPAPGRRHEAGGWPCHDPRGRLVPKCTHFSTSRRPVAPCLHSRLCRWPSGQPPAPLHAWSEPHVATLHAGGLALQGLVLQDVLHQDEPQRHTGIRLAMLKTPTKYKEQRGHCSKHHNTAANTLRGGSTEGWASRCTAALL
jgi:hypothetical protein